MNISTNTSLAMTLLSTLLLLPVASFAQNYMGMNEAEMQKMMQQMQKMASCVESIDQNKLKQIEQHSYQLQAEVKALCASGKRDDAQEKVISFSKEISSDPTMQEMRKCGEMMKGEMPPMMPTMSMIEQHIANSSRHVCD